MDCQPCPRSSYTPPIGKQHPQEAPLNLSATTGPPYHMCLLHQITRWPLTGTLSIPSIPKQTKKPLCHLAPFESSTSRSLQHIVTQQFHPHPRTQSMMPYLERLLGKSAQLLQPAICNHSSRSQLCPRPAAPACVVRAARTTARSLRLVDRRIRVKRSRIMQSRQWRSGSVKTCSS